VLTRSSGGTTATSSSGTSLSVAWLFDNTTTDSTGNYNGSLVNGATYGVSTATMPYLGQGQTLYLVQSMNQNQSFQVDNSVLNLAYTSFTIEAWIYPSIVTGDNGIFGICQCSSCSNQCLYLLIRGARLYAGFYLNDINGLLTVTVNTWHHIAFVYNYETQQQILYINGVQDNSKSNSACLQRTNATINIGSTQLLLTKNYFSGHIDNLRIVTRAKSASEILSDASLIAYYSFDLPSPNYDSGPNGLHGSSVNTASVTGRVNQAMRFIGSSSYFQAYGFYQLGYGVYANRPYSVSIWINPASTAACAFLQQSTTATGGSCFNMLGLWTYTGQTAQIIAQGYAWPAIVGPFITINTWIHISWTFSLANGYALYVNGNYYGTTGYFSYTGTTGVITWLQLGYNFGCSSQYITNAAYQGSIDEVYLYNRELSATEVRTLANP